MGSRSRPRNRQTRYDAALTRLPDEGPLSVHDGSLATARAAGEPRISGGSSNTAFAVRYTDNGMLRLPHDLGLSWQKARSPGSCRVRRPASAGGQPWEPDSLVLCGPPVADDLLEAVDAVGRQRIGGLRFAMHAQ